MEEKNHDNLRRALQQLPSYDPPASLWDSIGGGRPTAAAPLDKLPQYQPPPEVWNHISRTLTHDRHRIGHWRRWAVGAAAATALAVGVAIWLLNEPAPRVSLAYAQEEVSDFGQHIDWNEEEITFDKLSNLLASYDRPELNQLEQELTELSDAKTEVENILRAYGQDPTLIRKLGEIERERSTLYRQIIEKI